MCMLIYSLITCKWRCQQLAFMVKDLHSRSIALAVGYPYDRLTADTCLEVCSSSIEIVDFDLDFAGALDTDAHLSTIAHVDPILVLSRS